MSELSRLRWLCRRGMKELDVVVTAYLDEHYAKASSEEQRQFRELLEMADPDVYGLLLGRDTAADPRMQQLIDFLRGMSSAK
jgi:antitoxin CptB